MAEFEAKELKGNSHKERQLVNQVNTPVEKKKIQKVLQGQVIVKKKGFLDNLSETFFGSDTRTVGSYIVWDVLIPAAKNTIAEMINTGIEMLFYGSAKPKNISRNKDRSFVSYSSYYQSDRSRDREPQTDYRRSRNTHRFDDIIIPTRIEAEEVLGVMMDMIDQYGVVTVADFYDLVGIDSEHTDHKYGWNDISTSSIQRVRNGYILLLPKTVIMD